MQEYNDETATDTDGEEGEDDDEWSDWRGQFTVTKNCSLFLKWIYFVLFFWCAYEVYSVQKITTMSYIYYQLLSYSVMGYCYTAYRYLQWWMLRLPHTINWATNYCITLTTSAINVYRSEMIFPDVGTPDVKSGPIRYQKGLQLQLICCTPFRLLSKDFGGQRIGERIGVCSWSRT